MVIVGGAVRAELALNEMLLGLDVEADVLDNGVGVVMLEVVVAVD